MTVEQNRTSAHEHEDLSRIIKIDEAKVSGHLNGLVRQTVQETLNEMLDAEPRRRATPSGTSGRRLARTAGRASTSASSRPRPAGSS